jgi:hypothetical protein
VTYTGPNSVGAADAKMLSASGTQYTGHSNPMTISSAAGYVTSPSTGLLPQPNCALVASANPGTAVTITYGCGINGVQANSNLNNAATGITPPFANCRWYIPVLEMNAEYEESLIAAHPTKTFYYDDFLHLYDYY